ncbi:MAG: hypothetical protein ABI036_15810 [Fibrobacteria bacterium]
MTISKTISTLSIALALFGGATVLTPSQADAAISSSQQNKNKENAKKQNEKIKAEQQRRKQEQERKAREEKAKAEAARKRSHPIGHGPGGDAGRIG